jgi:hypothetical protein
MFRSRSGKICHPIVFVPAGLKRSLRRLDENKFIWGFISMDGTLEDALQILSKL